MRLYPLVIPLLKLRFLENSSHRKCGDLYIDKDERQEMKQSAILFYFQVSPDAVRPHVGVLLEAMIECFKDEGWPVRDGEILRRVAYFLFRVFAT